MKIVKLDLLAFGPFTEQALELGDQTGLHLVYGPNEAGKSSTLRALRNLLFGIPANTPDNFIHPHSSLRIGATLRNGAGPDVDLIRRKGTKNTLLRPDGRTPHDDSLLDKLLGGISQNVFDTVFGIDHDELVRGGRAITRGDGDVGQILFAAGSGIADLETIQKQLESEAEALFKPGGKNPKINALLSRADAARKEIKDALLPSSKWLEHDKALKDAQAQLAKAEAELADVTRERTRLQRTIDALPLIGRRSHLREQLSALGAVPILRPEFGDRRRDIVARLSVAQAAQRRARDSLTETEKELKTLVIPDELLAMTDQIDRLRELLGSYRKAQQDLPGIQARREQLLADARRLLKAIRPDLTLEAADELRISKSDTSEIIRLGKRLDPLTAEERHAASEVETLTTSLAAAQRQFDALPPALSPVRLQEVVQRWQAHGNLEQQLATARAELVQLEDQAAIDLRKLPLWSGSLEDLERLPAPSSETIDRFETQLATAADELKRVNERKDEAQAKLSECRRQIEQLQLEGAVLTESDLAESRRVRGEEWEKLLSAWRGVATPDRHRPLLAMDSPDAEQTQELIVGYEKAVRFADDVSDRLRREAARVSMLAQLASQRDAQQQQIDQLLAATKKAEKSEKRLHDEWLALWKPSAVEPASPREMRAWQQKQQSLCSQAQGIRASRAATKRLEEQIDAARRELLVALRETQCEHLCAETNSDSLTSILSRSRTALKGIDLAALRRQQLAETIADLTARREQAAQKLEQARSRIDDWREQWSQAAARLGVSRQISPAQADDIVAQIQDLFVKLDDAADKAERIEGIGRDSAALEREVRHLAQRAAPELVDQPLESAIEQLLTRLRKAQKDDEKRTLLSSQADELRAQLMQAEEQISAASTQLQIMCREAGCNEASELPEVERLSAEALRLREALDTLEEQLRGLSAGQRLDQFIAEVEVLAGDDLAPRVRQLIERAEQIDQQRAELHQTIGSHNAALRAMDGNAQAADRSEHLQQLLAEIESEVEQYARLRLASAVLREAVTQYRERNEGPVLRLASEFFAQLTLGSFEGIRADFDERGAAVLVGVRAGGKELVSVNHLSEGTADQLYLALRLAALQEYLKHGEPLPLVVDDILVNFDDERAVAALRVLAQFAATTQVIFFTHHQHLLRLGMDHLSSDSVCVHELPGRNLAAVGQ